MHTRAAFPIMAETAVKVATQVVASMPLSLRLADVGLLEATALRKAAVEASAAAEREAKEAAGAAEDLRIKCDAVAAKLRELTAAHAQLQVWLSAKES